MVDQKPAVSFRALALIFVGVVALILMGLVFKTCQPGNVHRDDKNEVDSLNEVVELQRSAMIRMVQEHDVYADSVDAQSTVQRVQIEYLKQQLAAAGTTVRRISHAVVTAKTDRDTAGYISNCDSLAVVAEEMTNLADSWRVMDSVNQATHLAQLSERDTVIERLNRYNADLFTNFGKVSKSYGDLYVDYSKEVRKRKRAVTLNRILAGAVLGLGAVIGLSL